MSSRRSGIAPAVALIAVLLVAACTSTFRNHGYAPNDTELAEIVVGIDTRDTVAETVGTPSTSGVLNESGYYYVSSRMRHFAYRAPEVVDRQVVAISFDSAGVVTNIERFTLEDGQVVPLSRRITDTAVANTGFLRQLLGNIGGFNPGDFLN